MSELKLPELFGSRVFNEETMKERLSGAAIRRGSAASPMEHLWNWLSPMRLPGP